MTHDPLCPVIPADANFSDWGCQCDLIAKVRADEAPKAVTRWIEQGASSDDWMKVWQVRDYAEELEAKVEERSLLAQIDHYNNGWEMAVAEIRQIVEFAAHKSDCVCYCCRCIQDDILSSIDSLKGKS